MSDSNQKSNGAPFLGLCFVLVGAVAIIYFIAAPKPQPARRLWTPIVVETNGAQTILGDTRQMEFWTPSVNTKDFLKSGSGGVRDKEKWQIIPDNDMVLRFGALLHSNGNVIGFRRVEVWGQGRTDFKPGWWWSVNVNTNCPVSQLAKAYQDFWKPPSPVFIEVIDNRGSDN